MPPVLVVAEFVFTEVGEAAFLPYRERTLDEVRRTPGCLQAVLWTRPGRRYLFSTLWAEASAVGGWVDNEFHATVLMPGFRKWCSEGCFGEYLLQGDHERARRCSDCGRWTRALPGWDEQRPDGCRSCGATLERPLEAHGS